MDPYRYVTTVGRTYTNARLRLSLELPHGWVFSSIADFAALRERQELLDALPGEYHALRDPGSLPVLLIEDERAQRGEANPGVVLFDEEADPPADEADGHRRLLDRFASSYRDLTVRHHPAPITLRGADATVSSWEYTHEWDGMGIRRTVRTILVFRERHAHTFHLGDNTESPWVEDDVWNELLGSVRYG